MTKFHHFQKYLLCVFISSVFLSCRFSDSKKNLIAANQTLIDTGSKLIVVEKDRVMRDTLMKDSVRFNTPVISVHDTVQNKAPVNLDTVQTSQNPVVSSSPIVTFAETLLGSPYLYGSQDPKKGFDSSGFVNYVYEHFGITTPRYAAGFIITGDDVPLKEAQAGDLILFSQTDSIKKVVNHIGIVTTERGQPLSFIHATSGKVNGVIITPLNSYYKKRLIAVRRVKSSGT